MAINPIDFLVKNGLVVSTTATILGGTSSTSTSTGALLVSGGIGVNGAVYASAVGYPQTLKLSNTSLLTEMGTIDSQTNLLSTIQSPNLYDTYIALDTNLQWTWDGTNWVPTSNFLLSYQNSDQQYTRAPRTYTNRDVIYNGLTADQLVPGDYYYDDGISNPAGDGYPHLYMWVDTGQGYANLLDILPPNIH
jgi:hypothetical protein